MRDFKNEHIALFYLPFFPPQSTPKVAELLYNDWYILYIKKLFEFLMIENILKAFLNTMSNTNNSQSNNSQSKIKYTFAISFACKYYTFEEFLTVFPTDFLDLIYQHNVLPPESLFAAIRISLLTFNFLIIAIPSFTHYKIFYRDNRPTLCQRLTLQFRPLFNNQNLTKVIPHLRVTKLLTQ